MAVKKYFKLNYTSLEPSSSGGNTEVTSDSKHQSVTVGKPYIPARIRNPHEGITIIDHAGSTGESGGFLNERFKRS